MAHKIRLKSIDEGETVILTGKGVKSVNNANALRNADVHVIPGDEVLTKCRQTFNNKKDISTNKSTGLYF